jgi:hypothetical protein
MNPTEQNPTQSPAGFDCRKMYVMRNEEEAFNREEHKEKSNRKERQSYSQSTPR